MNKNGKIISAAITSFLMVKETHISTHNFVVNNQKTDNDGRILLLHVTINDVDFVLINLYNVNTETE